MNWDDTRIFLAIHRERSLRSAARIVGLDQATVSRRLATLERALGATLFLRTSRGYVLTKAGEAALHAAERMEQSAIDLVRQTQGADKRLAGDVRVTTTDSLGLEFVMTAMRNLHHEHPEVRVLLNISTQVHNLAKREADIAVRTVKPDNPDLLTRRLAAWPMGLYASADYLERHGEPVPGTGFERHELVFYLPHLQAPRLLTLVGEPIHAGRIVSGLNSSLMLRAAVRAGLGISELPVPMAERDGLVRIWPDRVSAALYEVWMVTHKDLRHTARVSAMIDHIVQAFEEAPPASRTRPGTK
ncbi:LysR family transcriptional regulator [Burkholderia multivorans]|uniref:LysR family transcriptional regulator n=1 Tax=Burkholderia multivorans TaxID=87883 RepID=UPI0004F87A02|nr:LysR family transcriptional regulator [Burkholderia multivorans]AIO74058.1 bacterial regulatory helix-turn-helix, lysR family protein [Burkholderia multivorans]